MAVLFLFKNIRACTFLVLRVAYTLSLSLHCAAKCLYELCFEVLLCLTKTSKRAVHGTVSPHPCVHAGVFLCSLGIISTVSKPLRYALPQEYVCAAGTRGLHPLRCGRYALTCAPSLRSAYVPYAVAELCLRVRLCYARLTFAMLWQNVIQIGSKY